MTREHYPPGDEDLHQLVRDGALATLAAKVQCLRDAIRKHRDQRGDDRCYLDDRELYAALPEGYTPRASDTEIDLEDCRRYKACRQDPATVYESPQRRIEQLEAEADYLNSIDGAASGEESVADCAIKLMATMRDMGCAVTSIIRERDALRLVHQEARELVGEADATGTIPAANLEALRALLWRASRKQTKR